MSKLLPIRPDLDHLKHEARSLQRSHDAGQPAACPVLRHLHRFAAASDADILAAPVTLTEVQFALAREYGFKNWDELRKVVLLGRDIDGADAPPDARALRLPDPPAGSGGSRFSQAFRMAISCCGPTCDLDTIAGDSGLAFILQSDSKHSPYGADVKELDLGWWPLDDWGAMLRLDFLGRTHGIPLRRLTTVGDEYKADPAAHFRKHHLPAILDCLHAGRPAIATTGGDINLVTGIDDCEPPLLGQLTCSAEPKVQRLGKYPWVVIVTGNMIEPIDRLRADREAIAFACDLHHERFSRDIPGTAPEWAAVKSSGKASFALWAQTLRDGRCGPHFYSGNVVGCTKANRRSAPPYLRQMAKRHGSAAATPLNAAADIYDLVLEKLSSANTSKDAFATDAGRLQLATVVDAIALLEAKAAGELQLAADAMRG